MLTEIIDTISRPPTRPVRNYRSNNIQIDIVNEEKTIYIYAELAGVKRESIVVDCYNNKLTISCERIQPYENASVNEIKVGKFTRTITLPICITKNEAVEPSYKDGILKIKINKLVEEENKFSVKLN